MAIARRRARGLALPLLDALVVATAAYLSFALRFDDLTPWAQVERWLPVAALPVVIRPLLNRVVGLYAHSWRHVSVPELLRLCIAVGLGSIGLLGIYVALAAGNVSATAGFPRSFWVFEAVFSAGAMATLRLGPRILADVRLGISNRMRSSGTPTILYGAGEAGAMMARAAFRQASAGVRPVAFLDGDPRKWGKHHAGVAVMGGLPSLGAVVKRTSAEVLLITMPTAAGEAVRQVADAGLEAGLHIRTIPSLDEMLGGSLNAQMIRPLHLEDLLRRPPVPPQALAKLGVTFANEVILVTGAGGSIGSELARQLYALGPKQLVLLDRAEGALYEIQRELTAQSRRDGKSDREIDFRLADITNQHAIARLVRGVRPSIIFHAAAYKHVPVMEEHPLGAVEVNVGGTLAILEEAAEQGVERLVLVSTDKAVEPANVMGATKRLAELLVADFGRRLGRPWAAVRFGNVLGSSGSVVPIFQKQLAAGEPLTVTHEQMTRYFMTIPEAVHLVLQAGALACPADVFVLDMGEPVRILDLARDLIRLSGRDPSTTPIEFTGLRPGEKLHERLTFDHERIIETEHPKIRRLPGQSYPRTSPVRRAKEILDLVGTGDPETLRRELMTCVRLLDVQTASLRGSPWPGSASVVGQRPEELPAPAVQAIAQ